MYLHMNGKLYISLLSFEKILIQMYAKHSLIIIINYYQWHYLYRTKYILHKIYSTYVIYEDTVDSIALSVFHLFVKHFWREKERRGRAKQIRLINLSNTRYDNLNIWLDFSFVHLQIFHNTSIICYYIPIIIYASLRYLQSDMIFARKQERSPESDSVQSIFWILMTIDVIVFLRQWCFIPSLSTE